jgi:predicted aspartyl protease
MEVVKIGDGEKRGYIAVTVATINSTRRWAMLDTGCTLGIVIPHSLYITLGLTYRGTAEARLANNVIVQLLVCRARVNFGQGIEADKVYVIVPEKGLSSSGSIADELAQAKAAEIVEDYYVNNRPKDWLPNVLIGTQAVIDRKITFAVADDGHFRISRIRRFWKWG